MSDLKWVSCSKEMAWSASESRHLIRKGGLTTLCGCTASHPEVWRGNSTKPDCSRCVAENAKFQPQKVVSSITTTITVAEGKPTEVKVQPIGTLSRRAAREIAYAALEEAGFDEVDGLDSMGYSSVAAFFEPTMKRKP